jgi:hypothetical protein
MNRTANLTIFLTGKNLIGKNLIVFNDGELVDKQKITKRALVFSYYLRSVSLEYFALQPSVSKKIKIITRQFYKDIKQYGVKSLFEYVAGFKVIFSLEGNLGNFEFKIEDDSRYLWVSRAAVNYGVQPYSLNHAIEYDFLRFRNTFAAFIWGLRTYPLKNNSLVNENLDTRLEYDEVSISEKIKPGDLNFFELNRCEILQGKNVVQGNVLYPTDLYSYTDDSWPSDLVVEINGKQAIIKSVKKTRYFEQPSFYFGSSTSWFHFLVEVFPRYLHYGAEKIKELTPIIEHNVPTQILDVIRLVSTKPPIHLFPFESAIFRQAIVCTEARFSKGLHLSSRANDLRLVRDFFQSVFPVEEENPGKKIFLIRSRNLFRYSKKIEILNRFCEENGFEIIDTANLSMMQQVKLFSQSILVVGETGSALTNLIFCRNDCKIIEINLNNFMPDLFKDFTCALDLNHRSIEKISFKSSKVQVVSEGKELDFDSMIM